MDTKLVAETIYQQLGGGRFKFMTGASKLSFGDDSAGNPYLQFNLPSSSFNVDKISMVQIILDPSDTYTIKFFKKKKDPTSGVMILDCFKSVNDVYCDNLQDVFEIETNLVISFNRRASNNVKFDSRTGRLSYL